MATNYYFKSKEKSGLADLFIRIRSRKFKIDFRLSTNLKADIQAWNNAQKSAKNLKRFKDHPEGAALMNLLDAISKEIDSLIKPELEHSKLTKEQARKIIDEIVYKEQRERQAAEEALLLKAKEESEKVTLVDYIANCVKLGQEGKLTYRKGKKIIKYQKHSIKNFEQTLRMLREYQDDRNITLRFEDINMNFYNDLTGYLEAQDASQNSIGRFVKDIKAFMNQTLELGLHTNLDFKKKDFVAVKEGVDSIALSEEDLQKIIDVDLSEKHSSYNLARELFLVGTYTAQRVSDYNNIKARNISSMSIQVIEDNKIVNKEVYLLTLKQQKTKAEVCIPIKQELLAILKKYDFNIPRMAEQKINEYIKEVAKLAGLTNLVEIKKTKGGKEVTNEVPTHQLITTHTARRTGATLMYLNGIDVYDIMKLTGHKKIETIEMYLKVSALARATLMAKKYSYFGIMKD